MSRIVCDCGWGWSHSIKGKTTQFFAYCNDCRDTNGMGMRLSSPTHAVHHLQTIHCLVNTREVINRIECDCGWIQTSFTPNTFVDHIRRHHKVNVCRGRGIHWAYCNDCPIMPGHGRRMSDLADLFHHLERIHGVHAGEIVYCARTTGSMAMTDNDSRLYTNGVGGIDMTSNLAIGANGITTGRQDMPLINLSSDRRDVMCRMNGTVMGGRTVNGNPIDTRLHGGTNRFSRSRGASASTSNAVTRDSGHVRGIVGGRND